MFAVLTLLFFEQSDQVSTPTEIPRQVYYNIDGIAPQGHAPWLQRLLSTIKEDVSSGIRPLPWIIQSVAGECSTLAWSSYGNTRTLSRNTNLVFCQGSMIDGAAQPIVVGAGAVTSPFCQSILISIANPRVYHSVMYSGSGSSKEFSLHTFPKSVLRQIETALGGQWLSLFLLPLNASREGTTTWLARPKNLAIRFGRIGLPSMVIPPQPRLQLSPHRPRTPCGTSTLGISLAGPSTL